MRFVIYQSMSEPDVFVVTDAFHDARNWIGKRFGTQFERLCELSEMVSENTVFDEKIAKERIRLRGYCSLRE